MEYIQQQGYDMTSAELFLMQRVLCDLRELPQDVSVAVDLTRYGGHFPVHHQHAFQATLLSLLLRLRQLLPV